MTAVQGNKSKGDSKKWYTLHPKALDRSSVLWNFEKFLVTTSKKLFQMCSTSSKAMIMFHTGSFGQISKLSS
jgi:glutathione peroxidase-family protein